MTFLRILRYVVLRAGSLFVTVVIGVYLAILIANMKGLCEVKDPPEFEPHAGHFSMCWLYDKV